RTIPWGLETVSWVQDVAKFLCGGSNDARGRAWGPPGARYAGPGRPRFPFTARPSAPAAAAPARLDGPQGTPLGWHGGLHIRSRPTRLQGREQAPVAPGFVIPGLHMSAYLLPVGDVWRRR